MVPEQEITNHPAETRIIGRTKPNKNRHNDMTQTAETRIVFWMCREQNRNDPEAEINSHEMVDDDIFQIS